MYSPRLLLRKTLHAFCFDLHHLPVEQLTLRDLDFDLRYLVSSENPIVFDVGANKGQSIERVCRTWRDAKIYAFEPNPGLAAGLKLKHTSCKVIVEAVALGSVPGRLDFSILDNDELSSCLILEQCQSNPFANTRLKERISVPVRTLDMYADENRITQIDLLKIDTQGFDLEVLRGAAESLNLRRIESVLVEVNFVPLYHHQGTFGEIERFLAEKGYGLLALYEVVRHQTCISWATACFRRK